MFAYATFIIFSIAGQVIGFLAEALYLIVNIRVYPNGGLVVINESWKIMRNFANMFFIVALIMMAFATIFNITKYEARTLFPKFLVAALLINFSLVLGVLVIDASQVLSNTFLVSIGNFSNRLGESFINSSVDGELLPTKEAIDKIAGSGGIEGAVFGTLIRLIFAGVLFFTLIFSLLTAAIFAIIRIPILWALLVVSPIAWILNVFPAGQGTYEKWWKLFIGWNMFLPIFLFFLYFGLYFLQSQGEIMTKIGNQTKDYKFPGGLTLQTLFFYVLTSIFLIGGTIVAMKASMFSGTGVVSVAKWARTRALRTTGIAAWQRGGQEKWKEMQQEGYGIGKYRFGGEKAFEREATRRARMLGTKGALEKGVEMEKEKQKPFANNTEELGRLAEGGSREQMLAARTWLTELGDQNFLTQDRINETLQMAGGERSELGNKYLLGIDSAKVTEATRKWISETVKNIEVLRKNAIAMIEKDKLSQDEIQKLSRQFTNDMEKREFLNKGYKKNLLAAAQVRMDLGLSEAKSISEDVEKALGKMTEDQIIEMMSDSKFEFDAATKETKSPEIRRAFANVLGKNPKKLGNLAAKASGDTHEILSKMIEPARQRQIDEQAATLKPKEQKLKNQIAAAEQERLTILSRVDSLKNYPTSEDYKRSLRDLESKEGEIKSLRDKADKIDERIEDIEIRVRGAS